ncbi:MAG: phenylalanine--tRNA ligase subunit beta [Firmicutes bacterium]|nr:phenylalanine--tRNA ligase subunit beta [Bacillota bacterium]
MKVPMQWIRDYADIPTDAALYTRRMIMTGTAVEGTEVIGEGISGIVTGRILSMERHPDSDHLWICQVDVGGEAPLQIVTGAQNLTGGEIVPVCLDGAALPGGKAIKAGKLRGVESRGMLCGGSELGVDDSLYPGAGVDGILIFREEHPLGVDVRPLLGLGDTAVEYDILANRPDCQCVWGVARESAAAFGVPFKMPLIAFAEHGGDVHEEVTVEVLDTALCPRYAARVVKNVRVGPSPLWLRAYLHGAGMRSINNIVDITNFVMLETGHPMHAFDLSRVKGRRIIVRRAAPGETLRTLDGKDHMLTDRMLVIADAERATGLAGIMGGEESEIAGTTAELLFECAAFDRTSVRLTARALGIRTQSSARFEKGVAPATVSDALHRACQLVDMLGAGETVSGEIDIYPNPLPPRSIEASVKRIQKLTGVTIPAEDIAAILKKLCFDVALEGDTLTATPPPFRQDVDSDAALAEEALRFYGYDTLPSTLPQGEAMPGARSPRMRLHDKVRGVLTALGGHETMSYAFTSAQAAAKLGLAADDARLDPVLIRNPLGEDTGVMRTTLAPALLTALSLNLSHQNEGGLLFECGAVFEGHTRKEGELPVETQTLCLGAYGPGWDFYRMRGVVLELFRVLGIQAKLAPGADVYYHPGRSATLTAGDEAVARLGEVHPDAAEAFDISCRVYLAEVNLEALARLQAPMTGIRPLPRFPAVTRDVALVMDDVQPVGPVLDAIRRAGGKLLEHADMFDVYRGTQLGTGKKSVAFTLRLRAEDRTLTDEEVGKVFDKIVRSCETQFGAEMRR